GGGVGGWGGGKRGWGAASAQADALDRWRQRGAVGGGAKLDAVGEDDAAVVAGDLGLVTELHRAVDAALADRPGIGVMQADQPGGTLRGLPGQPGPGLDHYLPGALDRDRQLLQRPPQPPPRPPAERPGQRAAARRRRAPPAPPPRAPSPAQLPPNAPRGRGPPGCAGGRPPPAPGGRGAAGGGPAPPPPPPAPPRGPVRGGRGPPPGPPPRR